MFSSRLPDLSSNRLSRAIESARAAGTSFVDLTESNPTQAGFDYPRDLLDPLSRVEALTYTPSPFGALDARRAVAADYARQGLRVAPERIVLTAGTSEAYSLLFKLLADAGDDVLVPRPSYPLFDHLTRLDTVVARPYALDDHGRWSIDVDSIERAATPRTRAVLVVTPNNPTGSYISRDECDWLASFCGTRGIAIVADEVFADYALDANAGAGSGRVVIQDRALAFALGGLSKSAGLPQVKLGWIAASGPAAQVDEALRRLDVICDAYLSVSTPVQIAAAELIARGGDIRSQIVERVRANLQTLHARIAAVPACSVRHTEGGWYAVLQVPSFEPEEDLVVRLLTEHHVLAHPGYFFDFPRESFLIVSLLPRPGVFADGIERIARHFDCTSVV